MKIVITGATGFIGSHLCQALVKEGHQVLALVSTKEKKGKVESWGTEGVIGDLKSTAFLGKIISGTNVVYHLAAVRDRWGATKDQYHEVNVLGTKNLLEAAKKDRVKHFIFCSSVTVLGYPKDIPTSESASPDPKTLYGQSKYKAEELVKDYQKKGLQTTVIRPSVVYGPGDTSGMMLKLCRLVKEKKFKIVGNGQNRLQLIYIDDLILGLLLVKESRKAIGEIYILTYKDPISVNELVKVVADTLWVNISLQHIPLRFAKMTGILMENFYGFGRATKIPHFNKEPLVTKSKVDLMTKNQVYDISKAKKELGFNPKVGYKEGIKKTIKWYKENGYL